VITYDGFHGGDADQPRQHGGDDVTEGLSLSDLAPTDQDAIVRVLADEAERSGDPQAARRQLELSSELRARVRRVLDGEDDD
jgi:hypothetical protein